MGLLPGKVYDGGVSVGGNASVGGGVRICGGMMVGHNLKVCGWLEASNIKDVNKGLFASADKLSAAYPRPRDGWWALVGDGLPADVYRAEDGAWVKTGAQGGDATLDCSSCREELSSVGDDLEKIRVSLSEKATQVDVDAKMADHQAKLDALAEADAALGGELKKVRDGLDGKMGKTDVIGTGQIADGAVTAEKLSGDFVGEVVDVIGKDTFLPIKGGTLKGYLQVQDEKNHGHTIITNELVRSRSIIRENSAESDLLAGNGTVAVPIADKDIDDMFN